MEYNLPVIIHSRCAFYELCKVMDDYKNSGLRGVFHCFSGDTNEALRLLEYPNFMLGIGGTVTYKKNALPAGTVLGQSPAAGTMMTPGVPESRVDLVVSGGPSFIPPTITTTVPKITGMSLDAAMATLEKYGIVIRNITYSASNEPDGTVLWQSASAGSLITGPDGEIPIDVVVSRHR